MHAHSGIDLSWMNADGWTPIVGYRRFKVPYSVFMEAGYPHMKPGADAFRLRGLHNPHDASFSEAWDFENTRAACWQNPHEAPDHNCKCGLHGWMDVQDAIEYQSSVSIIGSVIGWGRMLFDDLYWRAEYARPVALLTPDPYYLKQGGNIRLLANKGNWIKAAEKLTNIASRDYGIPILELTELEAYTLQYGDKFGGHPNGTTQAGAADGAANSASDHAGQEN